MYSVLVGPLDAPEGVRDMDLGLLVARLVLGLLMAAHGTQGER